MQAVIHTSGHREFNQMRQWMTTGLVDKVMISMLCVSFLSSIAIFIAIPLTVRNEKLGTLVWCTSLIVFGICIVLTPILALIRTWM